MKNKPNILDIIFSEDRRPDGKRNDEFIPNLSRPREISRDMIQRLGKSIKEFKKGKGRVRE
jgi:hypothetical protein